jgi:hypothetical protein
MRFKNVFIAAVPVVLAACAAIEPQQFVGPNSKTAYSMKCSGMGRTLDACYKKAGEICPGGYNIIDRATGTIGVPMQGGGTIMTPEYNLAIECK